MLKFKFDYLNNTLAIHQENLWHQIAAERQFTGNFGNQGFKLENGWITFTLSQKKIQVFYKHIESPNWFTYYRKDLPPECPVVFTFKETDQIEKVNGKWVKKGGSHE